MLVIIDINIFLVNILQKYCYQIHWEGGGAIEVKFTHFQTILVFFKFKFLMSCFLKTGKGLLLISITNKFCNQLTLLWLLIASRISVQTVEICSITIVKPNSNSTVHLPIVTS